MTDNRRKNAINTSGHSRRRDDVEVVYIQQPANGDDDTEELANGVIKLRDGLAFIGAMAAILFAGFGVWSSLNTDVTKQSIDLTSVHSDIDEFKTKIEKLQDQQDDLKQKIQEHVLDFVLILGLES